MEATGQDNTPPAGTDYAATHCRQCVMGWTRVGKAGGVRTVCLLDRELVLADMTSCDRYELKPVA
jgi:hypothetical protein